MAKKTKKRAAPRTSARRAGFKALALHVTEAEGRAMRHCVATYVPGRTVADW